MFPHKSGGFPLYANEGWRKYTTLIGPIATFGYWIGWSVVLAFLGLFVGSIAQAAWWPKRNTARTPSAARRSMEGISPCGPAASTSGCNT